mgnify:CR=1 FL=1
MTIDWGVFRLHIGDCLSVMREMPDNSIDSIVTDLATVVATWRKDAVIVLVDEAGAESDDAETRSTAEGFAELSAGSKWKHLVDPPNN